MYRVGLERDGSLFVSQMEFARYIALVRASCMYKPSEYGSQNKCSHFCHLFCYILDRPGSSARIQIKIDIRISESDQGQWSAVKVVVFLPGALLISRWITGAGSNVGVFAEERQSKGKQWGLDLQILQRESSRRLYCRGVVFEVVGSMLQGPAIVILDCNSPLEIVWKEMDLNLRGVLDQGRSL